MSLERAPSGRIKPNFLASKNLATIPCARARAPSALEISLGGVYLGCMQLQFQPAIPTRGTKVPVSPDWIHEVKQECDGRVLGIIGAVDAGVDLRSRR